MMEADRTGTGTASPLMIAFGETLHLQVNDHAKGETGRHPADPSIVILTTRVWVLSEDQDSSGQGWPGIRGTGCIQASRCDEESQGAHWTPDSPSGNFF